MELLVPELQRRGIYWNDYPVPGGTMRENLHGVKGQNLVEDDHPASKFKWDKREEKLVSAWDNRKNGVEMAAKEKEPAGLEATEEVKSDIAPQNSEVTVAA